METGSCWKSWWNFLHHYQNLPISILQHLSNKVLLRPILYLEGVKLKKHVSFKNLFAQTVTFIMWVKPWGNSSSTSSNICKNHPISVYAIQCVDYSSVIDQASAEYQLKITEAIHITSIQPKLNKQVKYHTLSLIV